MDLINKRSDLDLLVRYKETVSLFDVDGLKCELEKLLGIKVDLSKMVCSGEN